MGEEPSHTTARKAWSSINHSILSASPYIIISKILSIFFFSIDAARCSPLNSPPPPPPVAEFLVPDWGDLVDSGKGLSYRPARIHRLAGRYDNPMPVSTLSPVRD